MDQNNLYLNNILKNLNILYIEDEENIRINITKTLKILAKNVYDVETLKDANYFIKNKRIDIIISDINLGEDNGLDFIEKLRTYNKSIPVILLSAYTDTDYLLKAKN